MEKDHVVSLDAERERRRERTRITFSTEAPDEFDPLREAIVAVEKTIEILNRPEGYCRLRVSAMEHEAGMSYLEETMDQLRHYIAAKQGAQQ